MLPKDSGLRFLNRGVPGLCLVVLLSQAAFGDQPDEHLEKAKHFVSQMAAGEYDKAVEPFDETMKRALPAGKLNEIWSGLVKQYGPLRLRYEKRTKQHPILMSLMKSSITVKEETIDDAVAAVKVVNGHNKIGPNRIFVLGHSLGGMLIPRIAKAESGIAGFICLAGSARPLEDHVLEQTKYILSLDGELTEDEKKKLQELEQQVAQVKSPDLAASTPVKDLPLGAPAAYWLDLRGYDPAKEATTVRTPILVLHGERDYQVTMEDFARWKDVLAGRADVELISYPQLNHLFIEGQGKSTPQEYSAPGNVAAAVIGDIAKWIEKRSE